METKEIFRGYGKTAGKVTAVKVNDKIYLFGYNPTDHSRDVKPAGKWIYDKVIGAVIWEKIVPVPSPDSKNANPKVWETEQADWEPVNWMTPIESYWDVLTKPKTE